MSSGDRPTVGFIGPGDQGLPVATAIADAGYELHAWARRPASLQALGDTPCTAHPALAGLAAASDIVAQCVSTGEDVLRLAAGLVPHLRPGSLLVNHGAGSGQLAKLFNNTLLMMNQASIAGIPDLAARAGTDAVRLAGALKLGSASSAALTLPSTMITPQAAGHLAGVQALGMEIFAEAMREAAADPAAATAAAARGLSGTHRLPGVIARLTPERAR